MDQTQLQQQIATYYEKLPSDVQEVFSSMKWMDTLGTISTKYNLTEEQKEVLGTETTLVLLGIIGVSEYEDTLRNEVKIEQTSLVKMMDEVEGQILATVRPQLAEAFEKNLNDLAEEKYGGEVKLDERFAKLPQEVREAISESGYQTKLYNIGEKQKLSISQMGALDEVTTKIMIGIIHPDEYEKELQSKLATTSEVTSTIVNEVNEEILKNIREILKKNWDKEIEAEDEVPLPPYAVTTSPQPAVINSTSKESSLYAGSGITLIDSEEISVEKENEQIPLKEDVVLKRSGVRILDKMPVLAKEIITPNKSTEKKILDGIENPSQGQASILGGKLTGVTKSVNTTTDYSLPKITQSSPSHDPYHEVIE